MWHRINLWVDNININKYILEYIMNVVYLGEKWFYLTLNKRKYYLVNDEGGA